MQKITTFLMFYGQAEEAVNFYVSLFKDSEVVSITRYGADGPGKDGAAQHIVFLLHGQQFMALDSNVKHEFTFTPAISLFVECETEQELDGLFKKLSEGGQVLMPLDNYGFSEKFGWVADRFGVSWQLNLAKRG
jgi:predicted 3-demethylubiquinone-9 3-methyltransferase (glyoxalase superfamily)